MKVTIVQVTSAEQKLACTELLESDPDIGHIDTDDLELWAAIDENGELLGMAGATFDEDARHVELQCCVVSPTARGRGIQSRLIKARIAWARRQGAETLHTYASVENLPSIISLLKCGFRPREMVDHFLTVEFPLG